MSTLVGQHVEDSRLRSVQGVRIGTARRGSPAGAEVGGPGPADYSVPVSPSGRKSPSVVFGHDRRRDAHSDTVPGPGAHHVDLSFTLEASPRQPIGTSSRFSRREQDALPGPGAYAAHLVDSLTGKSISSGRVNSARPRIGNAQRSPQGSPSATSPGPAYSPNMASILPSSPGYSVGRARRDAGQPGAHPEAAPPGPGRYAPEAHDASLRPASPRQPIGSAQRFQYGAGGDGEGSPGPGAYATTNLGPSVSQKIPGGPLPRSAREPLGGLRLGDGPGVAYATTEAVRSVRPRSASALFGRDSRFKGASPGQQDAPSPASYHATLAAVLASSPTAVIGRSARGGPGSGGSAADSPGPGAYAVERLDAVGALSTTSAHKNSPRQRIGSARRDSSGVGGGSGSGASLSPGPAYSPRTDYVLPRSAGFAMPRSPREAHWSGTGGPGPQDYAAQAGFGAVRPSSPQVRIGTARRFPEGSGGEAPIPGPGAYGWEV
jgi:hypothetical protein